MKIEKIRNKDGITLIALIITIIVMLILAGIVLGLTISENGIMKKAGEAGVEYSKEQAREKLELVLLDMQADKSVNSAYNQDEYLTGKIEKNGFTVQGNLVTVDGYTFEIDRDIPKIIRDPEEIRNKDLLSLIDKIDKSGYYDIKFEKENVDNVKEEVEYHINAIVSSEDLVLDGVNQVAGSSLQNNIYEFGDATTDCGTATTYAENMVILKVDGNLIINEGVTLTSCKNADGYGGPKGLFIYCKGTITNNGTISMKARGAKAEGENVYLWQNEDGSYEYVPAIGGEGAAQGNLPGYTGRNDQGGTGKVGGNGTNRGTGGGGSGGIRGGWYSGPNVRSGRGGAGTSYSGGSGSGGFFSQLQNTGYSVSTGVSSSIGGEGSNAAKYGDSNWYTIAYGGTGNKNGYDIFSQSGGYQVGSRYYKTRESGTGGLLVLNADSIYNIGSINANGVDNICSGWSAGGGASGGGSINIFVNHISNKGSITATGGSSYGATSNGGAGGNGTVTIGSVATGSFVQAEE